MSINMSVNAMDLWFLAIYFGVPVLIACVGIVPGRNDVLLRALTIACVVEIVCDMIFAAYIFTKACPLTNQENHMQSIIGWIFVGTAFMLYLIHEASRQQKLAAE